MLGASAAAAQPMSWPERPIRLIVPFTAGSSSDIVARIVAQKLGERLKQQLVVDNRVGASGNLGTEAVARAEPDGYTLGLANTSTHAVTASLSTRLGFDPVKDFAPVSLLGASPFVLAAYPRLPAKSVAELIALAKARPRTLSYAHAGPATLAHLSGALFEKKGSIELINIPYRGTAQSTLDLIEGRVDMQFGRRWWRPRQRRGRSSRGSTARSPPFSMTPRCGPLSPSRASSPSPARRKRSALASASTLPSGAT